MRFCFTRFSLNLKKGHQKYQRVIFIESKALEASPLGRVSLQVLTILLYIHQFSIENVQNKYIYLNVYQKVTKCFFDEFLLSQVAQVLRKVFILQMFSYLWQEFDKLFISMKMSSFLKLSSLVALLTYFRPQSMSDKSQLLSLKLLLLKGSAALSATEANVRQEGYTEVGSFNLFRGMYISPSAPGLVIWILRHFRFRCLPWHRPDSCNRPGWGDHHDRFPR